MSETIRLSEVQLALMRVLWRQGEATIAQVCEAVSEERRLAYTSVATMLKRLEQRGVVTAHKVGREWVYRPCVSESVVRRSMVGELLSGLFAGDASALMSHLVEQETIAEEDLDKIRQLLATPESNGEDSDDE